MTSSPRLHRADPSARAKLPSPRVVSGSTNLPVLIRTFPRRRAAADCSARAAGESARRVVAASSAADPCETGAPADPGAADAVPIRARVKLMTIRLNFMLEPPLVAAATPAAGTFMGTDADISHHRPPADVGIVVLFRHQCP